MCPYNYFAFIYLHFSDNIIFPIEKNMQTWAHFGDWQIRVTPGKLKIGLLSECSECEEQKDVFRARFKIIKFQRMETFFLAFHFLIVQFPTVLQQIVWFMYWSLLFAHQKKNSGSAQASLAFWVINPPPHRLDHGVIHEF